VDYQDAEKQVVQIQQQAEKVADNVKALAAKLQSKITDADLARELSLDLREAALAIQQQNQSTVALIEQMAQYIHELESHSASVPQVPYQSRGWANQSYGMGSGGFMSNVMQGVGMGAGFGLANDIVGGLFGGL